jgi:hypothetical protein
MRWLAIQQEQQSSLYTVVAVSCRFRYHKMAQLYWVSISPSSSAAAVKNLNLFHTFGLNLASDLWRCPMNLEKCERVREQINVLCLFLMCWNLCDEILLKTHQQILSLPWKQRQIRTGDETNNELHEQIQSLKIQILLATKRLWKHTKFRIRVFRSEEANKATTKAHRKQ